MLHTLPKHGENKTDLREHRLPAKRLRMQTSTGWYPAMVGYHPMPYPNTPSVVFAALPPLSCPHPDSSALVNMWPYLNEQTNPLLLTTPLYIVQLRSTPSHLSPSPRSVEGELAIRSSTIRWEMLGQPQFSPSVPLPDTPGIVQVRCMSSRCGDLAGS